MKPTRRQMIEVIALTMVLVSVTLAFVVADDHEGLTPREYAYSWPRCNSIDERAVCITRSSLPCVPTGWDVEPGLSPNEPVVCSPAKLVWDCPFVTYPYDDGHVMSLGCHHGEAWRVRDATGSGWHDEFKGPWACELKLYTYMDPRKWKQ